MDAGGSQGVSLSHQPAGGPVQPLRAHQGAVRQRPVHPGENIGDLGGLTIAHKAYLLSLDGKEAPVLDGFTGEQRFFLGWAQVWKGMYRPELMQMLLASDPHSPPEYRVNGVVPNIPAFYEAFKIQPGDKLYLDPAKRVKIW